MNITLSTTIHAPISLVFQVFTDLSRAAERISGIDSLEMLEGPAQMTVGTKWSETRTMMGKEATEIMWVSALTPNHNYCVDADSHGTKYHSDFQFTEVEDGTMVTWTFSGKPYSLPAKLMSILGYLFIGSLKKTMAKDLEDLKTVCETD